MEKTMLGWLWIIFSIFAAALVLWAWNSKAVKLLRAVRLENRGVRHTLQGRVDRGEPLLRTSLRLAEEAEGPNNANVGMITANLAQACYFSGKTSESEQLYKRAISIIENSQGKTHEYLLPALGNYATLLESLDRKAEADALRVRKAEVEQANPDIQPTSQGTYTSDGLVLEPPGWREHIDAALAAENASDAEDELLSALKIAEEQEAADPHLGETLHLLGELYFQQHHFMKAADFFERAVSVRELAFGAENSVTESSRIMLAKVKNKIK
jgi:tetratricopeptide (TPR) repeat protein